MFFPSGHQVDANGVLAGLDAPGAQRDHQPPTAGVEGVTWDTPWRHPFAKRLDRASGAAGRAASGDGQLHRRAAGVESTACVCVNFWRVSLLCLASPSTGVLTRALWYFFIVLSIDDACLRSGLALSLPQERPRDVVALTKHEVQLLRRTDGVLLKLSMLVAPSFSATPPSGQPCGGGLLKMSTCVTRG